jgi:hypothetical protein
MSNPPAQDEPGPLDPHAMVFARLADVPLDVVDKLIETTQAVYADLNRVQGHSYWADLVLHQGAAMRALNEARECLDALRAEAVGARNTELGIMVTTAVIDGERHYAQTEDEKTKLVDRVLRPENPGRACRLYVWDRPHESDELAGPYTQVRIVTDSESELGVLNFTEETEEGELRSWHTFNPEPVPDPPILRFDAGSPLTFPSDSLLPFADLRRALIDFGQQGQRPENVRWQQARWAQP